ncbi:MAG: hypothetical protein ACREMZ_17315, partial [Gemmatimonadales bacterium]
GPEYWQRIQGHARRTVQGMEPVETRERPFRADHSDAAMRMARAWATTPADPGGAVIAELKQDLTPAQLIEGMHNLAVLMAMHRFGAFWHAKEMAEEKGAG